MTERFGGVARALSALVALVVCSPGCVTSRHRAPQQQGTLAPAPRDDADIVHFLQRTTFGARAEDVEAVRRDGVAAFLDRQLHPERLADASLEQRLARFETLSLDARQIAETYYLPAQEARRRALAAGVANTANPSSDPGTRELFRKERLVLQELSEQKLLRAVYSQRQLQEVLVDFWFNHFNVFAGKGVDRQFLTAYERDVIRPRVFGKFRDLLGATAESPAMLFYLDNWMSVDPNGPHAAAGRGNRRLSPRRPPVQPPARARRGLNENYARELLELHTLGVDGGYTQRDVVEVARCFTGWTIAQPRIGGGFTFDPRQHDPERKVVLGHVIKPGGAKDDGDRVLDFLARDPHTARFIATKLARRFVSDDPPPSLVERLASRFRETDGDLIEVYRALFASPEFWATPAYSAKAKTPFEFVSSALRTTGADVETATAVVQALRPLGMPLYGCQQPNGYADRADTWMTAGGLLMRMNFATALAGNRLGGVRVDLDAVSGTADLPTARATLVRTLLHDRASESTAASLAAAKTVPQLLALTLGSPDFQRR